MVSMYALWQCFLFFKVKQQINRTVSLHNYFFSQMLSGLLKSIPGRSLVLPLFVNVASLMRSSGGLGTLLLGFGCGRERAGLKLQQGSQAAGQILEFIEENRKVIRLRCPHYSCDQTASLGPRTDWAWPWSQQFWLLHSKSLRVDPQSRRHCQGQAVQVHQNYVKAQEEDRDGSIGHSLSRRRMSDQGMPRSVQDNHLEKKAQTEEL